jgi:hypothetical protein
LISFKKSLCFLAIFALIVTLGSMTSFSEINHSFVPKHESTFTEIDNHVISVGVFVNINQAASFNHLNQITIDYILVVLLVLFLVCIVNYQWYKPIKQPPWYLALRCVSRANISGWKASNLQYTSLLTYSH